MPPKRSTACATAASTCPSSRMSPTIGSALPPASSICGGGGVHGALELGVRLGRLGDAARRSRRRAAARTRDREPDAAAGAGDEQRLSLERHVCGTVRDMTSVLIVGAGFGGIAAAIELRRHGFDDVTHPRDGRRARRDVAPQHLSRRGLRRPEPPLLVLVRPAPRLVAPVPDRRTRSSPTCATSPAEHGLDRRVETGSSVTACRWDDEARRWTVETEDGRAHEADAVSSPPASSHQPAVPRMRGATRSPGHAFHSRRAGTTTTTCAASASRSSARARARCSSCRAIAERAERHVGLPAHGQLVPAAPQPPVPARSYRLADRARARPAALPARGSCSGYCESLTLAIRHPRTLGRLLGAPARAAFMRMPAAATPSCASKVWPDYTFGCKRILFCSDFLPDAARRETSSSSPSRSRGWRPRASSPPTARTHAVDCIIYGTGFRTTDFMFPMEVTRRRRARAARRRGRTAPHAHLGMTVPGFPSLFVMYGPNTNTSGGSIITYHEAQAGYIRQALELQRERGAAAIDVRPGRRGGQRPRGAGALRRAPPGCGATPGTATRRGRIVTNWPGYMCEYLEPTRRLDPAEFTFL